MNERPQSERSSASTVGAPSAGRGLAWRRYGLAVAISGLAILLRLVLTPHWGPNLFPFAFSFPVVIITAWLARLGPALLSLALCTAASVILFIEPGGDWWPHNARTWLALPVFVVISLCLVAAIEAMHRARERAEREVVRGHEREQQLERQAHLLDLSNDMIIVRDAGDRITYWNAGAEQIYGYTRSEALGRNVHELLQTEFPAMREAILETLHRHKRWSGTLVHTTRDGRRIRINSRWVLTGDAPRGEAWVLETGGPSAAEAAADHAVHLSELRFRTMADSAPVLIWITGPDKRCTWFNQRWFEFTGRTMAEEIGEGWSNGVHPDDRARAIQTYSAAFDQRQPYSVEYRLRRHDGAWRWILSHGIPLYGPDQQFSGYIGSCIDVTEQRESANALRESERRERERANELQTIMQAVPAIIWLARDPGGRVVTGNAASYEFLRLPPDSNASMSADAAERPTNFEVYADGRQLSPEELPVQRAARGEVVTNLEEEVRFNDGTSRYLFGNAVPLRDGDGRPVGAVAAFVDITERKHAERKLAAAMRDQQALYQFVERRHRARNFDELYDASLDVILDVVACDRVSILRYDDAGLMRFVRWRGLSDAYRQAVEGHSPWAQDSGNWEPVFVADTTTEIDDPALRAAVEAEGIAALAFVPLVARDRLIGKFMTYYNAPHAFTERERELHVLVAQQVALGIERMQGEQDRERLVQQLQAEHTRLERTLHSLAESEQRYRRASRAKDDFFAMLSHELRTPLNPVLLIATDAINNPALPEAVRADFQTIARNVALEARLIDDLLDLNRITHGKLTLQIVSALDVHATIREAVAAVAEEISAREMHLVVSLHATAHTIAGDPVRLKQVLWNLLKNAIKFTPAHGRIEVSTTNLEGGGAVEIQVRDSGIGMSPEELQNVFEPFIQGEGATSTNGSPGTGGLGLGLAISRTLIEQHGGTIRAESPGRGQGTTMTVRLPLATTAAPEPDDVVTTAAPDEPRPERQAGGRRILLVEDHAPTRRALATLLQRRAFAVTSAQSLHEARRHAADQEFDLLISDLALPDGDGCMLLTELRRTRPHLAGIVLSGYGMEADFARTRAAGFSQHLVKPVTAASLDRALGALETETAAPSRGH